MATSKILLYGHAHVNGITLGSKENEVHANLNGDGEIVVETKKIEKSETLNRIEKFIDKIPVVRGTYLIIKMGAKIWKEIGLIKTVIVLLASSAFSLLIGFMFEDFISPSETISMEMSMTYQVLLVDGMFLSLIILLKLFLALSMLGERKRAFRIFNNGRFKSLVELFRFHGAEHKTINFYEDNDDIKNISVDGVKKYSTVADNCGSSYYFIFLAVANIYFIGGLFVGIPILPLFVFCPFIYGISYELLPLAERFRVMIYPGLILQRYVITIEPSTKQIEVGIFALRKLVELEGAE